MATTQKSNRKKAGKPWFFKRPAFWLGLFWLGAVGGIAGWLCGFSLAGHGSWLQAMAAA